MRAADLGLLENAESMFVLGCALFQGEVVPEDQRRGQSLLTEAANRGNSDAMYELAKIKLNGPENLRDSKSGEFWLRRVAHSENREAMCELGLRLLDGVGLARDEVEGEHWLRRSADKGGGCSCDRCEGAPLAGIDAGLELARRLTEGDKMRRRPLEGEEILRERADEEPDRLLALYLAGGKWIPGKTEEGMSRLRALAGYDDGYSFSCDLSPDPDKRYAMLLAEHLYRHASSEEERDEAKMWLYQAVELGDPFAKINLADRQLRGDGLAKDAARGEAMLRELAAGESERERAMYTLFRALRDGLIPARGDREALLWLEQAAERGHRPAQWVLGCQLVVGRQAGRASVVSRDRLEELSHYVLVGGQSFTTPGGAVHDSPLVTLLAAWDETLQRGGLCEADPDAGLRWLEKAASARDDVAKCALALMRIAGDGLPQDVGGGLAALEELAKAGHGQIELLAATLLGEHLCFAKEGDQGEGEEWLERALESGMGIAGYYLGLLYCQKGDRLLASRSLDQAFRVAEDRRAGNLLFTLERRREIPAGAHIDFEERWLDAVGDDSWGLMNLNDGLAWASGFRRRQDWGRGDVLVSLIEPKHTRTIMRFWGNLAERNDPEGHLVLGWLLRHGLVTDPNGLSITERFDLAQGGGWEVPSHLRRPATP
jgi:TPR repeat protein